MKFGDALADADHVCAKPCVTSIKDLEHRQLVLRSASGAVRFAELLDMRRTQVSMCTYQSWKLCDNIS
jgi:hypothetical protein